MDDDYERILLIKPECFVYKLPPRPSSTRGYRAADWGLDKPQWTGRMRITATSKKVVVKLEDSSGQLFAAAPIDTYPGVAVESVTDSSRYFVLRVADGSGRTAFIGIGFGDRGDAFDFNVALQDHFNREKITEKLDAEIAQPNLNLGLKEGQTLTIKIGNSQANKSRPKQKTSAVPSMGISLPPPPGSTVSSRECPPQPQHIPAASIAIPPQQQASTTMSDWGEFTAAAPVAPSSTSQQWVQF